MRWVLGRAAECGVAWRGVGLFARDNADRHTPVHPNTVARADRASKPHTRVRAHTSNAVTRPLWSQKAPPSPPRLLFHSRLFSSFLPFVFSPPPPPPIFPSTPSLFFYHHHYHPSSSSSSSSLLQEGRKEGGSERVRAGGDKKQGNQGIKKGEGAALALFLVVVVVGWGEEGRRETGLRTTN